MNTLVQIIIGTAQGGSLPELWGQQAPGHGRWIKGNALLQVVPPDFPIKPSDIPLKGNEAGNFGKLEIQQLAFALLQMAHERGNWNEFTLADANLETVEWLTLGGWIIKREDIYHFTIGFVLELYMDAKKFYSPVWSKPAE